MKQRSLSKSLRFIALGTALILSVPLAAMQFTNDVNWSVTDFIIMGVLIFSTGSAYVLLTKISPDIIYRVAVALAIGSTFLLIWINLAVGLIGSGPNVANLMYIVVVTIVIIGAFLSRFSIKGMARVMFTAAGALLLIGVTQLLAKMNEYSGSSTTGIIAVNAFFAALFAVAGFLFSYTKMKHLAPVNHKMSN